MNAMGLHQLCTQIEQNSKVRAASILKAAKSDARRIEESAKKNSDDSISSATTSAKKFCELEAKERIAAAQLEASKLISDAKDEAVRYSLDQVWDLYSQSSSKPGYRQKLKEWATLALEELAISGAILRCNSSDKSILSSSGFKLGEPIDCRGGVRAESKDGRVMVDYTLEAQFESKKEELTKKIYSALFSDDDYSMPEPKKKRKRR